ncbi:MAG: hypothetical protein GVY32_10765, partial [Gammaproteobacteria bacterium]|nr:hypothetical protein [Gammaproteobacteria bacterium]
MISRLTHGFSDRCLRFTNVVTDVRARLASGWRAAPLPDGSRTRWVTMKGFRLHSFPLSRAYPDASWSHARRRFFELADIAKNRRKTKPPPISPIALE